MTRLSVVLSIAAGAAALTGAGHSEIAAAAQAAPAGLRVALVQQPWVPNGTTRGPSVMANGGIRSELEKLGLTVRVQEIGLTPEQELEYGGWKRLGYALGHLGRAVEQNERDGFFSVGLLGTCPSMPGMVAGMDVLDPREVEGHGNKVPGGPTSEELAGLFEMIFSRYPKASAIGFATIPLQDPGGLSLAAVNRMILGAMKGVVARQ